MAAIDTLKLLEQLEASVEDTPKFLGWCRIDVDEFAMLISKVRASLPEDVRRAGKIAQNSDRIMEAAQTEAEQALESARSECTQTVEAARAEAARLMAEAQARAEEMVSQSEIARIASAQAREIIVQAEAEAHEVRDGADSYATDVLAKLEEQIGDAMSQVEERVGGMVATIRRGRQKLEQRASRTSIAVVADRERSGEPVSAAATAGPNGTAAVYGQADE